MLTKQKPKFYRFSDLSHEQSNIDYHIHTDWTDGKNSVLEIIEAAEKVGLSDIAFTEHIRKDSTYFEYFYSEVNKYRKDTYVNLYVGVESKVVDKHGNLDVSNKDYNSAEIVLGSVHRIQKNNTLIHIRDIEKGEAFIEEFEYSLSLLKSGKIDILAHPAGMSIKFFKDFPEKYIEEIIANISETPIAFELNSKYMTPNV